MKLAFRLKSKRLARIEEKLDRLLSQGEQNHMDLHTLTAKVETLDGTVASASALLSGLGDLIRQNANDPVALQQLADKLDADNATLAAAVAANPLPAPAPVPVGGLAVTPEVNPADHVAEPL